MQTKQLTDCSDFNWLQLIYKHNLQLFFFFDSIIAIIKDDSISLDL